MLVVCEPSPDVYPAVPQRAVARVDHPILPRNGSHLRAGMRQQAQHPTWQI